MAYQTLRSKVPAFWEHIGSSQRTLDLARRTPMLHSR
jgi:hypothetical protein